MGNKWSTDAAALAPGNTQNIAAHGSHAAEAFPNYSQEILPPPHTPTLAGVEGVVRSSPRTNPQATALLDTPGGYGVKLK